MSPLQVTATFLHRGLATDAFRFAGEPFSPQEDKMTSFFKELGDTAARRRNRELGLISSPVGSRDRRISLPVRERI